MKLVGTIGFWLAWPGLWLVLRFSRRTRVLIVVDDEFLVVKNWLGANSWALPGGGRHKGEDPLLGALREVSEELGIMLTAESLQPRGQFRSRSHGFHYRYSQFVAVLPSKPVLTLQRTEISAAAWYRRDQLTTYGFDTETITAVRDWWH